MNATTALESMPPLRKRAERHVAHHLLEHGLLHARARGLDPLVVAACRLATQPAASQVTAAARRDPARRSSALLAAACAIPASSESRRRARNRARGIHAGRRGPSSALTPEVEQRLRFRGCERELRRR